MAAYAYNGVYFVGSAISFFVKIKKYAKKRGVFEITNAGLQKIARTAGSVQRGKVLKIVRNDVDDYKL